MDPQHENSDEFRKLGNMLFGKGEYFGALAQYNKSLVCARKDPRRVALCYGNRSAVYLELEYFEHCLHNIDLAEPNFPADKIQRLQDRRQRCLEMMKTKPDKALKVFKHEFKLSYKPNPKIPFFIDALQLKEDDPQQGKHFITTRDLKAGDIIAVIDKPWRIPVNNMLVNYPFGCYTCGDTNNGDLIPGKCRALFCSQECIDEHDHENFNHKDFNPMENVGIDRFLFDHGSIRFLTHMVDVCGSVGELRKFVDGHRDKDYTVFDFDWSECDDETRYKNMLLGFMNDMKPKEDHTPPYALRLKPDSKISRLYDDPEHCAFISEMRNRLLSHYIVQCAPNDYRCAMAAYRHPAIEVMNWGCDCNVVAFVNHGPIVVAVLQPIKAGRAVKFAPQPYYREKGPKSCKSENPKSCLPCKNKWTIQLIGNTDFDAEHNSFNFYNRNDPREISTLLKHIKSCADFINKNFNERGYLNDAKKRNQIATKMLELENIYFNLGNPFPMANMYLSWKPTDSKEKMEKFLKLCEFDYENDSE